MKFSKIRWLFVAGAVGALAASVVSSNVGCGSDNGKAGSGGSSGGGSSGTAGTSGGGTTGSGGAKPLKLNYTFDTATSSDSTSWKLNDYMDPALPPNNLGWYVKQTDAAAPAAVPTIEWASDDSEGGASSGSIKVGVTFTTYGQYVDIVINLPTPVDLTNSTLAMKIRLVSGSFPTGGAQFHFSTGAYIYSAGPWVNGTDLSTTWKTTSIDTSVAVAADPSQQTNFDPAMTVQLGVQIGTGGATDGGMPMTGRLVFEIDTITAR
jgi:hypothetical protein